MADRRNGRSLAQFCIAQHGSFAAEDWLARSAEEAEPLAQAAGYLSKTSWYGYEEELERIAHRISQHACDPSGSAPGDAANGSSFDLPEFSLAVRTGVLRRKPGCNRRQSGQ